MEEISTFLASDIGRIMCFGFLFVGVTDLVISKVIFGKKATELENSILPNMSPDEKEKISKQVKSMKVVVVHMQLISIAFIAFAVWGLTR